MAAQNSFFISSPSVIQAPSAPNEYFTNGHYDIPTSIPTTNGSEESHLPPGGSLPVTPGSIAGRKRSRGDALAMEEDEIRDEDGSVMTPAAGVALQPQSEPMLGPGMSLIYPDQPGYEARPESQSGTWVEERPEWNQFQLIPQQQEQEQRPIISTRKSQRMDSGAAAAATAPDDLAQLVLPPQMRDVTAEPLIDEATRTLGISWTRMDSTEPLRISQAAYTKWIQNHYPALQNVAIWFENSAIPGYLVQAQNVHSNQTEYYLLSQDLTEARLVTSDPSQLIPRLQMLPALELAAPGGCIRAEAESIVPERSKATPSSWHRVKQSEDYSMSSYARLLRGYNSPSPSQDVEMG